MTTVTVEVWSSVSHLFTDDKPPGRVGRLVFDTEVTDDATLDGLLRKLAVENPRFGRVAFDQRTDRPSGQVLVVLNNKLLEIMSGYDTGLRDGDRVKLVQAYAGG